VPLTANATTVSSDSQMRRVQLPSVFSVKNLDALFCSSGCRKGSLAARLSITGFALLKTLRLCSELAAMVVSAHNSSVLAKANENLILSV
jgi:hypothetical protein